MNFRLVVAVVLFDNEKIVSEFKMQGKTLDCLLQKLVAEE